MTDIAQAMFALSLIAVLGLTLGQVKFRGVGLGLGGVLFGGLFVGHFGPQVHLAVDLHVLHFLQEFGLILFVYAIGNQLGPGFFAALRTTGLQLNLLSAATVALGVLLAVGLGAMFDLSIPVMLGVLSGAVTNTPSLAATQQVLEKLHFPAAELAQPALGYAVAYPFGIIGILIAMWSLRLFLKVQVATECNRFENANKTQLPRLSTVNVRVTNDNFDALPLAEVPGMRDGSVVCSRLKHEHTLSVPTLETLIHHGDILHLVGPQQTLHELQLSLGELSDESLTTKNTALRVERVVVTRGSVLGKSLAELSLDRRQRGVVSRIHRAGIELLPRSDLRLQFGDMLNVVGTPDEILAIAESVGNSRRMLDQVQMTPIFVGIGLGVLLGSLPLSLPGLPTPVRLGLAGGPLLVAIILSRVGNIGPVHWFMPPSANVALREIGIVLFLAVVGLKAGAHVSEVLNIQGLQWMLCGAAITLVPLLLVGAVARLAFGLNYLTICGLLAGSCTDPPALAFANSMADTDAPALAYAAVYPVVMALRILSPQILAVVLAAS